MEMMGLSTEKTVACFPGSLFFSLEGIVGLCKPVLTLDRLTPRIFHWGADPEALKFMLDFKNSFTKIML
jgi:hypothetical protein